MEEKKIESVVNEVKNCPENSNEAYRITVGRELTDFIKSVKEDIWLPQWDTLIKYNNQSHNNVMNQNEIPLITLCKTMFEFIFDTNGFDINDCKKIKFKNISNVLKPKCRVVTVKRYFNLHNNFTSFLA